MFTLSRTTLCGLPSISSNAVAMTGNASTDLTMAHATRCVKESLPPSIAFNAPFNWARRVSRMPTGMVRNVVAVGIERLSSM